MKWNGDYSEDRRWMIQTARVRGQGTEYRVCPSREPKGGPPYGDGPIFSTRREAKAYVNAQVEKPS